MKVTIPDLGKGVNKDAQASELELGLWSDVVNFRPSNGFMEKWDGVSTLFSASTTATWLIPYLYQTTRYVVYGGTAVYARDASTSTQITPYIASQTITVLTNSGATTAGVTTGSAHGLTTGDTITVFGCTDTDYNVTDAAITVTGATTFTYPCGAIAAPASVIGEYIVTSSSALLTIGSSSDWQAIVLNGYVVINRGSTGIFYWAGDTAVKFKRFPFLSYSAFSMLAYKNYIVLLGPYVGGVKKPRRVAWSNAAEVGALPSSFTASSTNDAGDVELGQTDGDLVGGKEFNDVAYLYTQDARYAMRYIGGNDVFSFTKTGSEGLFSRYSIANTPIGQVFLTADLDVHIHQGGASKSIADGVIKNHIRSIMYAGSSSKGTYMATNPRKKEIWLVVWTDATGRTAILSWNWETGKWGIFTVPTGEAYFAANGTIFTVGGTTREEDVLLVSNGSSVGAAGGLPSGTEVGTWFGTSLTGTLERTGLHFDDRDITKSIQRSRWNIDGTATNTASIYHGASMYADTAPTYQTAATYTIGTTDYVNARSTMGRFGAIKLTTTAYPFRIRSVDLDVTTGGKR